MARSSAAAYLTRGQREELADLADAVLDEHGAEARAVSPVSIATAKGIQLVYGRYGTAFDGLLRHRSGRFSLFCNLDRVETTVSRRARFTLAHELGHYFITSHRNALEAGLAPHHGSLCEYESQLFVEQQVDCFASNLLLPRGSFLKKAKASGRGLHSVLSLADYFDTSVTATAIRYASLGVTPCVVIKWDTQKYGWKWLAEDAYAAGYRRTIEERVDFPPNGGHPDKSVSS